ncbi:MAG: transcriptional regulator [Mesorhizobium amorphae]|nr:MAG: transcriptional regulator [Mesorhizobium amorphae]
MNRGPSLGSRAADRSFVEKAADAWSPLPEWVLELARYADTHGLAGCAALIGYSKSAMSNVLNAKYGGDIGEIEQRVRGALMAETVGCPILGDIGRDRCLTEQDEPYRATSAFRVRLYHACRRGCPHARRKEETHRDR